MTAAPDPGVFIPSTQMYQELRSLSDGLTRVETKLDTIGQGPPGAVGVAGEHARQAARREQAGGDEASDTARPADEQDAVRVRRGWLCHAVSPLKVEPSITNR